jgi:hypothetical protein
MPRFFFHIRGISRSLSRDELGLDFPDTETACREAFLAASAIEDEFTARGQSPRDYSMEVVNASDEEVLALPFTQVFKHPPARPLVLRFRLN